jgi:histidine triad (HIT) family protein
MNDCLFCKMVNGEIEPDVVYQDDEVLAFNDIQPQAPTHILVIPKRHIATLNDAAPSDAALLGKLSTVAAELAAQHGFADDGYRVVMNCNRDGGQAVYHIHLHLLGGRPLQWPPG